MLNKGLMVLVLIIFAVFTILIGFKFKPDEKPKVVVVLKELNTQYFEIVKAGAEKAFRDFNIDGEVIAPSYGSEKLQNDMLENVLKEKPDVLVVSPFLSSNIPKLVEFDKKNIPVLLLDTDDDWKHKTSYIGTDNLDLGKKAGAFLASQLQPGDKVALVGGDPEVPVSGERIEGAKITLRKAGIKIAAEKLGLNNENEEKEAAEEILLDHPDVKGIIASNDGMALNVLEVIEEHGLNMPVTGADGITEMLELIEDGTLPGSVAQNPYDMGYLSVETALKVTKGEKVEKNVDSGADIIIKGNANQRLNFLNKLLK
jgi:ribose transport system substrate-binding protein